MDAPEYFKLFINLLRLKIQNKRERYQIKHIKGRSLFTISPKIDKYLILCSDTLMTLYVIDQLLQTISADLVIFHTIRSGLPLEIEETVVVWRLFPECVVTKTEVIDPEVHDFLDNLVIVTFSDDELQGSSILILCSRNFRVLLFGLFSRLLNSFLFFYEFIIRINNSLGRRTE